MSNKLFDPVYKKIGKAGYTRGADDDVIYQNRVKRNNTVLIPYNEYDHCKTAPSLNGKYENGFIVLIKPEDFFQEGIQAELKRKGLKLGKNHWCYMKPESNITITPSCHHGNRLNQELLHLAVNMLPEFPLPTKRAMTKSLKALVLQH